MLRKVLMEIICGKTRKKTAQIKLILNLNTLRLMPYALCLTPYALRLTLYALRFTPYALRLTP
jgi:hypothetical protein